MAWALRAVSAAPGIPVCAASCSFTPGVSSAAPGEDAAVSDGSDRGEESEPRNPRAAPRTHTAWQNDYFVLTDNRNSLDARMRVKLLSDCQLLAVHHASSLPGRAISDSVVEMANLRRLLASLSLQLVELRSEVAALRDAGAVAQPVEAVAAEERGPGTQTPETLATKGGIQPYECEKNRRSLQPWPGITRRKTTYSPTGKNLRVKLTLTHTYVPNLELKETWGTFAVVKLT